MCTIQTNILNKTLHSPPSRWQLTVWTLCYPRLFTVHILRSPTLWVFYMRPCDLDSLPVWFSPLTNMSWSLLCRTCSSASPPGDCSSLPGRLALCHHGLSCHSCGVPLAAPSAWPQAPGKAALCESWFLPHRLSPCAPPLQSTCFMYNARV